MRKLVFLCFVLSLIGGVAHASRETADKTTVKSPLFVKSLSSSISQIEGTRMVSKRLRSAATATAAIMAGKTTEAYTNCMACPQVSSDTNCADCYTPTLGGPTCDWTACPEGCSHTQQGLYTCSGSQCTVPTAGSNITCNQGGCGNTTAPTCGSTPGCGGTSAVTCSASVCASTCGSACQSSGPSCTIAGATCAFEPSCGFECDHTMGPGFTCGGICETMDISDFGCMFP